MQIQNDSKALLTLYDSFIHYEQIEPYIKFVY